jgi:hypothetical protein
MSASVKFTGLLALASAVAAVPHYQHNKFHNRAAYPTGGWNGAYNSTAVAGATGTGVSGDDKTTTIDTTSTSTHTQYSTIYVKPTSLAGDYKEVDAADASTGVCGATVTVTASEKVTVTVTPGGGAGVPTSSVVAAESSAGNGYGAPSSASSVVPVAESSSAAPEYPAETPVEATTSSVVETPVAETTTSVAAEYPAETPEATASSKTPEITASFVQKPVEEATSTAASSAAPSPTAGNSYTGEKRGLAYNDAGLCTSFGSKFGFGYNWGQVENNDIGAPFIPMMHGPSKSTADEWLANVDKAVKKGSTAVMGFNECDHTDQCNLSPEAACSAWKQYMNPVKEAHPEITIVGPSVTNGPAPMGLDWLSRFNDCCPDAVVDATNIHFYDIYDEQTIDRFQAQVEKAASMAGKKVWVTEFGLNPGSASEEQAASFLKDAMAYLDGSDKVQGYSWFMVGEGENRLNSGTGLSALGKVYAGSA